MNRTYKGGFTLIELMVGTVSATVLALVFSAVLIFGYRGWTRLKAEADMQTDADVAMRTMDRIVRGASNATWIAGTSTLVVTNTSVHTFSKPSSGSNLLWNTSTLIANRVGTFSCVKTGSIVAVTLRLAEGLETMEMKYSIFLRN
jgi:hypothetical protein